MRGTQAEYLHGVLESMSSICSELAKARPPAADQPTTAMPHEGNAEPETLDGDVELDEEDAAELEAMLGEALGSASRGGDGAGAGGYSDAGHSSADLRASLTAKAKALSRRMAVKHVRTSLGR